MTLAIKPFKQHPYDLIKKFSWHDHFCNKVNKLITDSYDIVRKEADEDGVPDLADESFLYDCFKDNVQFGLVADNWQVLKYFIAMFRIKIYKNMLGQWCFTDHDVEMYEHFLNLNVEQCGKCHYRKLDFKSGEILGIDSLLRLNGFSLYCMKVRYNEFPYMSLFLYESFMLDDMVRSVRGLTSNNCGHFFVEAKRYYPFNRLDELYMDFTIKYMNDIFAEIAENGAVIESDPCAFSEQKLEHEAKLMPYEFGEYCKKDTRFIELKRQLSQHVDDMFNKFMDENRWAFDGLSKIPEDRNPIERIKAQAEAYVMGLLPFN